MFCCCLHGLAHIKALSSNPNPIHWWLLFYYLTSICCYVTNILLYCFSIYHVIHLVTKSLNWKSISHAETPMYELDVETTNIMEIPLHRLTCSTSSNQTAIATRVISERESNSPRAYGVNKCWIILWDWVMRVDVMQPRPGDPSSGNYENHKGCHIEGWCKETEMSFSSNFCHCLHRRLQSPMQPLSKICQNDDISFSACEDENIRRSLDMHMFRSSKKQMCVVLETGLKRNLQIKIQVS